MKKKLRELPKVDSIMLAQETEKWIEEYGHDLVLSTARLAIDEVRQSILSNQEIDQPSQAVIRKMEAHLLRSTLANFRPIINATGIVLHTNMGRALLSRQAAASVYVANTQYNNLELNLETGKRGSRYDHVLSLIKELTGCEDALVVNNNAAAVLLALNTLAKGGETLLSRGEMVEIGGSFRVPEVMTMSGTQLVEVGTTNKTHLYDYEDAITSATKVILKVHTSNYIISGFSQGVSPKDLMELAGQHNLVVYEDLGSGFLADLSAFGITTEPRVQEVMASGIDVVSFSGDKLLGGPQAGILVGKKKYIERMKRNQLNRALRIDKMTIAALEATLRAYLNPEQVLKDNPTLSMLSMEPSLLKESASKLKMLLVKALGERFSIEKDVSPAGGGSLPGVMLPTYVVRFSTDGLDEERLTKHLRAHRPAVMVRKHKGDLILDVRTIQEGQYEPLVAALKRAVDIEEQRGL